MILIGEPEILMVVKDLHLLWSLVNPDAINLDASTLDDFSGNNIYEYLLNVIQLSGRFIYLDNISRNQSVRIYEAPLYMIYMRNGHIMM
jgi:hypothetical protein